MARKQLTKRAALLIGPAGTGKLSVAYETLKEANCQIVEHSAGAIRTRRSFEATIQQTINTAPLFGTTNALVIPNVDVMNPSLGGLEFLMHIINPLRGLKRAIRAQDRVEAEKVWSIPIILTLNDVPKGRLADLESDCETLLFERLSVDDLRTIATRTLSERGEDASEARTISACEAAGGDARSLLNILQSNLHDSTDKSETILESSNKLLYPKEPVTAAALVKLTEGDSLGITSSYFENYLTHGDLSYEAAAMLSDGDVIEARVFGQQDRHLLQFVGLIGCASALKRDCLDVNPVLSNGSSRRKMVAANAKHKQLADIRSQMLLEGHFDASIDRLAYLATRLTRALRSEEDPVCAANLIKSTNLNVAIAEDIVRILGFKPLRARDRGLLKRSLPAT